MKNYLRNTLLMTVLTVGLFFVLPQSRILAEEGEDIKQDDVSLNVSNQTDGQADPVGMPAGTVEPEVVNETPEAAEQNADETPTEGEQEQSSGETGTDLANSDNPDQTGEPVSNSQIIQTPDTPPAVIPEGGKPAETTGTPPDQTPPSDSTEAAPETPLQEGSQLPADGETNPEEPGEKLDETPYQTLSEDSVKKASVSLMSASVSNEPEPVTEAVPTEVRDNTYIEGVTYMSNRVYDYDMPIKFRYSDRFFDGSSYYESADDYNLDLATLSAVAAGTTSGSNRAKGYVYNPETGEIDVIEPDVSFEERFENQSKNVQEFMRQMGFSNISVNEAYEKAGTPLSAGVAVGMKEITDADGNPYTLISVFPRSTSYFSEWANGMEIGPDDTQDYAGMESAVRNYILTYLKDYLETNGVQGDIKIWAAGLSRGGGLVNLTAAYLDNELESGSTDALLGVEGVRLSADHIYAYTFGAPNAASDYHAKIGEGETAVYNPLYHNIHNFVATYDMIVGALSGKWPTTRYGADLDKVVNSEEARDCLDELIGWYALINDKDISELNSDYYMHLDEDGNAHYFPIDYTAQYGRYDGMNLEDFIHSYMYHLTETFPRDEFVEEIQTSLMFFGETYYGYPTEIKQRVTSEALLDSAKAKATEVAMEAMIDLYVGDYSGLLDLLKYVFNPKQILPDILLDMFDNIGMVPKWYLEEHREFTEEEIEDGTAREINRGYVVGFVGDLLQLGIMDPIGMYNLYRSYGSLWASHELDVDLSWLHFWDTEENQAFYLDPITDGEKWGYRMVTLPEDEDLIVMVYRGSEPEPEYLEAGIVKDQFYRLGLDPDYYIRMNIDSDGNRILFLRADQEYIVSFMPGVASASTGGMQLVEYQFMENRFVYQPEVVLTVDDYGVDLGSITLNFVTGEDDTYAVDRLFYRIGKIPFGETRQQRMLLSAPLTEKPQHSAEYYSLSKLIQLSAQASIGGAVSDTVNLLFDSSAIEQVKTAELTAAPADGYRFLGWYLNGQLISSDPTITRSYSFLQHSELLTARFELIPVPPKPDPKPDPKPTPGGSGSSGTGSSTIVEVAAVTNGQVTKNVRTVRQNKVPNTGDSNNAVWLFWMMLGLAGTAVSATILKED